MGWIKNIAIKTLTGIIGKENLQNWFIPFGFSSLSERGVREAYEKGAVLSSAINKRAQFFGNAKVHVMDSNGNEPNTSQANEIRKLLKKPNKLTSWRKMYVTTELYRMLYGYCVWIKFSAYEGAIPSALYIVRPDYISIIPDKNRAYMGKNEAVKIRIGGEDTKLTLNDLIIFNDIKTGFGEDPFFAQSRITALTDETILGAVISDAELAIIRNRGALGILTKDVKDSSAAGFYEDDRKAVQEAYKKYGISSNQWNIIIATTALKWQSMVPPLKDLMLVELEEQTAKKICGVFDVPYELLPMSGHSAYANRKEAKKELYQDFAIPTSEGDAELLTDSICGETGLHIQFDYSDIAVLQEDLALKAQTLSSISSGLNSARLAGNISVEEWRREMSKYIDIDPSIIADDAQTILAQVIGVGGTQSLVGIVTSPDLTNEQKRGLLRVLFNFTDEQALEAIPEVLTAKP